MRALNLTLAISLAACTGEDVAPTNDVPTEQALSSSWGGQTTTDEAPEFADAILQTTALSAEDLAVTDSTTAVAGAERLRLMVAWGYLKPHPGATEVVDWSGSIKVENAAVRVVRRLRFEAATDSIIRPRTDPQTIDFTSKTQPAADGLLLEVYTGPKLNPTNGAVTITFASAPITNTQTLVVGERLSAVVPVDDAGHVLTWHIVRPDSDPCREGFMRGQWKVATTLAGHEIGLMRGRISSGDGAMKGFLKGVFGKRADGNQVFFAKVIDADGKFLALIAGAYADGLLKGRILVGASRDDLKIAGRVRGHYFDATMTPADGDGGFVGRWSQSCGEDKDEGQPMTSDAQAPGEDGDSSAG